MYFTVIKKIGITVIIITIEKVNHLNSVKYSSISLSKIFISSDFGVKNQRSWTWFCESPIYLWLCIEKKCLIVIFPFLSLHRASLCLCVWGGPLHIPLSPRERSRTGLWEDCLLSCGPRVSEWHRWSFPAGRHMDHLHEGSTELFPLWRCSLLLPWAAEHLLPPWARPHLRSLHHQCVSGFFITYWRPTVTQQEFL